MADEVLIRRSGHQELDTLDAADIPDLSGTYATTTAADAAYQPKDADLTAIAGLSPSADDFLQFKSSAWANRTIAQVLADLAGAGTTFQPLDSDLTAIAALSTTSFGRGLLILADAAALLAAAGAAPNSADYLVGTANGSLSGEIAVGTTPGGELGGTWASPTVDSTHSGSAHTDFIAKAFFAAKGDLISASANDTPALVTVGADGTFLKADSGQTSGLAWATPTASASPEDGNLIEGLGVLT